jgi:peptidoglycan/LPS O-acetylase OafA/YrhL
LAIGVGFDFLARAKSNRAQTSQPLAVVWVWRRKANLLDIVGVIVLISFSANLIFVILWPTSAFYLPPARFWELLVGGALGYMHCFKRDQMNASLSSRFSTLPGSHLISVSDLQSVLGLVLLTIAVVTLDDKSSFPGWWALLPTVGALLLINAGSWDGRCTSSCQFLAIRNSIQVTW